MVTQWFVFLKWNDVYRLIFNQSS